MKSLLFCFLCTCSFLAVHLAVPEEVIPQPLRLSLQGAINLALERNPEVLAAARQVDAARGRSRQAWWPEDPQFSVEYEGIPRGKGLARYEERFVRLSQTFDFPTNILLKKRIAEKEVDVTRMDSELVKRDLLHRVKLTYYDLLTQWERVNLARQNLQLADDFSQKAQIRYQFGEGTHLEYVKAKVEKARAENDMTLAQNEHAVALAELNLLLARDSRADIIPTDSMSYVPLEKSVNELREEALRVHPRLRAMDGKVEAARTGHTLAWSSFLPALSASYFNQNIDGNPDFWGLELGISVPLWFPFRQRGRIQEATAELAQARFERENVRNELAFQIESAWQKATTAEKMVLLYREELLAEANEVYRIARRSYEEGAGGYLDLLEAQRTLVGTRSGYVESLFSYNIAIATLEKAMGIQSVLSP